jgi:hypothetical protein
MTTRVLVAVLVLVVMAAPRVGALDDVAGWQSTRWGMSEDATRAALEREGHRLVPVTDGRYLGTTVPFKTQLTVGPCGYEVFFHFLESLRTLGQVNIIVNGPVSVVRRCYDSLSSLLTDKYGPGRATTSQTTERLLWSFPSTTIELSRSESRMFDSTTAIVYKPTAEPPKKADRDKL